MLRKNVDKWAQEKSNSSTFKIKYYLLNEDMIYLNEDMIYS